MTSAPGGGAGWRGASARAAIVLLLATMFATFAARTGTSALGLAALEPTPLLSTVTEHQSVAFPQAAMLPGVVAFKVTLQAFEPDRLSPQAFGDWEASNAATD